MDENALKAILERHLADYLCRRGQILYSGIDTLKPGRFYVLAFNPAADGTNPRLCDVPLGRVGWSAYSYQCWHCGEDLRRCGHRQKLHQRQVVGIMATLSLAPVATFATNLFFVESRMAEDLNVGELWDPHWAVHREMLAAVAPTYIICLGNGDASAFSLLRRVADNPTPVERRDGLKKFVGTFNLGRGCHLSPTVVGVPHPSRPRHPIDGLRAFIGLD